MQQRPLRVPATAPARLVVLASGTGSLLASLLPRGPKVPGVVAQPLNEPAREFPIYAAWRKSPQRNPLIDALLGLAPRP